MPVSRQRIVRFTLAIVAGLVLAVAIDVVRAGGISGWFVRHRLPALYVGQGERVAVGPGAFYIDCRGSGSPTVVLEAGAGSGAGSWGVVFDELAQTTRTCAYDRAGLGASDARGRRTLRDAARDLQDLLDAAGERGPWVMVGFSLGGAYGRVFAADARDETAALVLVDSFDPDLQADAIHPLLGALEGEYAAGLDDLRATVAAWEQLDWAASELELRAADLGGLRIAALVAPRHEPRVDEATNEQIRRAWEAAYRSLSTGRVTYEYAPGSGHVIPVDRPDLVIEVVRRAVEEARGSG